MKSTQRRLARPLAVLAALALLAAACGGAQETGADEAADDAEEPVADVTDEAEDGGEEPTAAAAGGDTDALLDELYQAALDAGETSVNIYGPGEGAKQPLWDLWAARFGEIEVEVTTVGGGELQARLEQEHASGQHIADMVSIGDSSMMNFHNAGFFEPFVAETMEGLPDDLLGPDDAFHATSCQAYGMLYNTDMLSGDEVPAGFHDLTDPAYADSMVIGDPREPGGTAYILHRMVLDPDFGMEWLEAFVANGVTVLEGVEEQEIGARIARGEWALMPLYPSHQIPDEGPLEFLFPTEGGSHVNCHFNGIIGDAPNPNAARLMKTWMYSEEYQEAGRDEGIFFPVIPGFDEGPRGWPALEEIERVRSLSFDEVTEQAEYREQFQEVFSG